MAATIYVLAGNLNDSCDCTLKNGQYPAGTEKDITLTVKSSYRKNYVFNPSAPPYIEYRANNQVLYTEPFTIEDDYTCTLHTDLTAGGNAPESGLVMTRVEGILLNVTNAAKCNLTIANNGYDSSLPAGSYRMGWQQTITLTRKNLYWEFDTNSPPIIRYIRYLENVGEETFTIINADQCTIQTTLNPFPEIPEEGYSLEGRICEGCYLVNFFLDTEAVIDCECNLDAGYQKAGSKEIVISCDKSYEFDELPTLVIPGTLHDTVIEFTEVDSTTYKLTYNFSAGTTYYLHGAAKKKTVIGEKYGFIQAYRLTRDEVVTVANSRWKQVTFDPEKYQGITVAYIINEEYIDTAKYVVKFFKLYAPIETLVKQRLMFGPYNMGIDCDLIEQEIITLDCGSVQIIGKYGNNIDYTNTTIDLYLPFVGFVSLSPADFMNKEVGLTYQVNTLNGEALAILSADGEVMQTHTCSLALEIPFRLDIDNELSTGLTPNSNYLLDRPPFVQVKAQKAVDVGPAAPYRDTKFYAQLGTLTGYTQATEIDFVVVHDKITKTEIDEILSLIEAGIFL